MPRSPAARIVKIDLSAESLDNHAGLWASLACPTPGIGISPMPKTSLQANGPDLHLPPGAVRFIPSTAYPRHSLR